MAATRVTSGSEETMEEGIVIVAIAEWEDTDPVMVGMVLALSHSVWYVPGHLFVRSPVCPCILVVRQKISNPNSITTHSPRPRKRKTDPYSGAMQA